jgi:hypothetical protein
LIFHVIFSIIPINLGKIFHFNQSKTMQHFQKLIYLLALIFGTPASAQECGAFVAPGVWRPFMCHNRGERIPVQIPLRPAAVGGYWQWGKKGHGRPGPSRGLVASLAEDKAIPGWNTTHASNGA